ncbi:MAG: beta-lactamase family protein [Legionellales bacterium]|nr:beta-lactamase family protein [Legionellales bacterium]
MRIRNYLIYNILFLSLFFSATFAYANEVEARTTVLNNILVTEKGQQKVLTLQQAMAHFKVPAISFAIIQGNKIIWADAFGYTNSHKTKKVNTTTLFQAGSMSKSVAGMTALALVDKGVLKLDEPVNPLLNSWKINKPEKYKHASVTLRELLSMSSGLDVGGYYGYEPGEALPSLVETLKGEKPANNSGVKLTYEPGTKYFYSGGGYEVIQLLIKSQASHSFPDNVQKFILTPLGMLHSNYDQPLAPKLMDNAAWATGSNGTSFPYKWRVVPEYAAGGLWSTSSDFAKFVIAVMKAYEGKPNAFLSQRIAQEALTQQKNTPYGLGFVVAGYGSKLHFMKLGQNAGYQGWLVGFPNTKQGAVVMTNSDNGRELAQDLIYSIAKAYKWPTSGKLKDAWMIQ